MKIVVTGASGFLGGRIAEFYKEKYEVVAPTHAQMDICDGEAVRRYMERERPDVIVHCAAVSDVGTCQTEPERSYAINVNGSVHVAEAGKAIGVKCILCSSDQVYVGSEVDTPHREDEPVEPPHAYGQQKLTMERRCLAIDPTCILLRLSWMYDVRRNSERERENFMTMLLEAVRGQREMRLSVYDKRGITDVNEVARNIEKLFDLPGGVYNFGAYNDQSMYDTMREVLARLDGKISFPLHRDEEAFADRPRNLCMSVSKAEAHGIVFSTTADGIYRALLKALA